MGDGLFRRVRLVSRHVEGDALLDAELRALLDTHEVEVVAQLAAAIERLYRDPDLKRGIGENARRKVRENFLIDSTAKKYLAVYEESLNGRIH